MGRVASCRSESVSLDKQYKTAEATIADSAAPTILGVLLDEDERLNVEDG